MQEATALSCVNACAVSMTVHGTGVGLTSAVHYLLLSP